MDTSDRFDSNLPVPFPAGSSLPSGFVPAFSSDLATTPGPQINSRVILRGLRRYGWYIVWLSLAVFVPVAYLIWHFVEPTYEAFSILQVEPVQPKLYSDRGQDNVDLRSVVPYLQTQVKLMTSDRVLEPAVASSSVAKLPVITKSQDPKADLRKKMDVEIQEDSYLIRVALELPNGDHAAKIVNAVVDSYLSYNKEYKHGANAQLKANLQLQLEKLQNELETKSGELQALHQKGTVEIDKPKLTLSASKSNEDPAQPTFSSLTEERVQRMVDQMVTTDLELIAAKAALEVRRQAANRATDDENSPQSQQDAEQLQTRITEEFHKDPAVVALIEEIKDAREQCDRAKAVARLGTDPAQRTAEKQYKKLTEQYEELWNVKFGEIKQRLKVATGTSQSPETINELAMRVEELTQKKADTAALFELLKIEKKEVNSDTFQYTLLNYELQSLLNKRDQVTANLAQLDFESEQDNFRVVLVHPASEPKTASNNKLIKYMAAAPVGILFMVLGLFLLLEIKAERVADPDSLSTRVRSEVYALPPLPTARSLRKLSARMPTTRSNSSSSDSTTYGSASAVTPAELGQRTVRADYQRHRR